MKYVYAGENNLNCIDKLWKANRATLGLMPLSAFKDFIIKGQIIVSLDVNNFAKGYLLFRYVQKDQAVAIVHLCISDCSRGKGVGEGLLNKLIIDYKDKARGIRLNCRNDYKFAIKFWERNSFQPKREFKSRSKDPTKKLTTWWFNFGKQDLFSSIDNNKIKVVLDYNIIAGMRDVRFNEVQGLEVAQLLSDWIIGEADFYYASETINKQFKDPDIGRRENTKELLKDLAELNVDKASLNKLEIEIKSKLNGEASNELSSRRQIAEAILSGFPYFITLDSFLLKLSTDFEKEYSIKIISPSSFILELDSNINSSDYYPEKLSGSNFLLQKASVKEKESLYSIFLNNAEGETKSAFNEKIKFCVVSQNSQLITVKEGSEVVAFYGIMEDEDCINVSLIRTKKYSLRQTIFMQNLHDLVHLTVERDKKYLSISDSYLANEEKEILTRFGFELLVDNTYIKATSSAIIDLEKIVEHLSEIMVKMPEVKRIVQLATKRPSTKWHIYNLEQKLWPLKIKNVEIPCFIIPINPSYAAQLFDTKAAKQNLFGSTPSLIWNMENVYYRNVVPNVERFPARILWYASADSNSNRQMAIVASSYLDAVITGPANEMYRNNKRYGVYDWDKHILPLVKNSPASPIKVLKFSNSESFKFPIQIKVLKQILLKNKDKDNNFQCPLMISEKTYFDLYKKGKGSLDL